MRMCRADVEVYCKSRCVYMCDVVEEAPSASSSQAPASASSVTSSPQAADPLNALSGRKRCVCVCVSVCVCECVCVCVCLYVGEWVGSAHAVVRTRKR